MPSRRSSYTSKTKLTPEEVTKAIQHMMAGAEAHLRASIYCRNNPDAKVPNIEVMFFSAVAWELILNSIEQSLRLLLLMNHSYLNPTHNIEALYKAVVRKDGAQRTMRTDIVDRTNAHFRLLGMNSVTEIDIRKCLHKHDSSYSSFRYFGLKDDARFTLKWEMTEYEAKLLSCLAIALFQMNSDEMHNRGIGRYASLTRVSEGDIPDKLREFMANMNSPSWQ